MSENIPHGPHVPALEPFEPSPEQVERMKVFGDIVRGLEASDVAYTVTGSIGLDGLYGRQTRAHGDIDILVKDSHHLTMAREILSKIGVKHREKKQTGGEIYVHPGTNTEVSIKTFARIRAYSNADEKLFFPDECNADLQGVRFRTPRVEGHDAYRKLQQKRADELGWGPYRHKSHQDTLIATLKRRT
jgi:hypothetical protein